MKVRISEAGDDLTVEVEGAGSRKSELLQAFRECGEGCCSCPNGQFGKVTSLEVGDRNGTVVLRVKGRPGAGLSRDDIEGCVAYTVAKASGE